MQTITIAGIHVRPVIGVYAHEHVAPQDIYVDLRVVLRARPFADDLATTLDYDRLVALVEGTAAKEGLRLIETMGELIVEAALEAEPLIAAIDVTIHKPAALKNGRVAVMTSRERVG